MVYIQHLMLIYYVEKVLGICSTMIYFSNDTYVGPNGIVKEQSHCSDEVDYSKESESEKESVSNRLKSSQVHKSLGKKAKKEILNNKKLYSDSDNSDLGTYPSRKKYIHFLRH